MVQGVITRLAGNSLLLKGWSVTLAAGLAALAKSQSDPSYAWSVVLVVTAFAVLDGYYLAVERAYRALYDDVAREAPDPTYRMRAEPVGLRALISALWSVAVLPFHTLLLVSAVTIAARA